RQRQRLGETSARVGQALLTNTRAHTLRLARVSTRLRPAALADRIARASERADGLEARATKALENRVLHNRRRLDGTVKLLASLSYQSVLARGFAVVRAAGGAMIR